MKKLITLILVVLSGSVYSQYEFYNINFEDTSQFYRLKVDTLSNPNNCWQIGKPQKTIFASALSIPNAIVTDTVNSYPTNDTSSFIIKHLAFHGFATSFVVSLAGLYFINSDTLTDFGKIEFSPDNGITWLNLLDSILYDTTNNLYWYWKYSRPILTGNSGQWKSFNVNIADLGHAFGVHLHDTVLYRYTFISDSVQTNKEGLMFDDLHFRDYIGGFEEILNQFESKILPNPSHGKIEIQFENNRNEPIKFLLFDVNGKNILLDELTKENQIEIDLTKYKSGIYVYKLINIQNNKVSIGKIMKE